MADGAEKIQRQAFRAVMDDDLQALVRLLEPFAREDWTKWRNFNSDTLLDLAAWRSARHRQSGRCLPWLQDAAAGRAASQKPAWQQLPPKDAMVEAATSPMSRSPQDAEAQASTWPLESAGGARWVRRLEPPVAEAPAARAEPRSPRAVALDRCSLEVGSPDPGRHEALPTANGSADIGAAAVAREEQRAFGSCAPPLPAASGDEVQEMLREVLRLRSANEALRRDGSHLLEELGLRRRDVDLASQELRALRLEKREMLLRLNPVTSSQQSERLPPRAAPRAWPEPSWQPPPQSAWAEAARLASLPFDDALCRLRKFADGGRESPEPAGRSGRCM